MQVRIRDDTVQRICETEFPSDILNKRKGTVKTASVNNICGMINKGILMKSCK